MLQFTDEDVAINPIFGILMGRRLNPLVYRFDGFLFNDAPSWRGTWHVKVLLNHHRCVFSEVFDLTHDFNNPTGVPTWPKSVG